MNVIIALLGLGTAFAQYTQDQARIIHARISAYFLALLALVAIGYVLNIIGWGGINLLILIAIFVIMVIVAFHPNILFGVAVIEALNVAYAEYLERRERPTTADGERPERTNVFSAYLNICLLIAFWIGFVFLVLGTVSFHDKPGAFLIILATSFVLAVIAIRIGPRMNFDRYVRRFGTILIITTIISLVPLWAWIKYTGYDIPSLWKVSESEKLLADFDNNEEALKDKQEVMILNLIKDKRNRREKLSPDEIAFLKELRERRKNNSIPGRISNSTSALIQDYKERHKSTPPPTPAPAPQPAPSPAPQKIAEPPKAPAAAPTAQSVWNIQFSPNTWNRTDFGFQRTITLEPGNYRIEGSGTFVRSFQDRDVVVGPEGRRQAPYYSDRLPFASRPHCSLIAQINGETVWIGRQSTITVRQTDDLRLSINETQSWTEGTNPAMNFVRNTGSLNVKITKL